MHICDNVSFLHICVEGKLVRTSFMGVFPEITTLNTYMVAGKRCHASYTVGKSCTPVELEMNCNGTESYIIIIKSTRVNVEKVYAKLS